MLPLAGVCTRSSLLLKLCGNFTFGTAVTNSKIVETTHDKARAHHEAMPMPMPMRRTVLVATAAQMSIRMGMRILQGAPRARSGQRERGRT